MKNAVQAVVKNIFCVGSYLPCKRYIYFVIGVSIVRLSILAVQFQALNSWAVRAPDGS